MKKKTSICNTRRLWNEDDLYIEKMNFETYYEFLLRFLKEYKILSITRKGVKQIHHVPLEIYAASQYNYDKEITLLDSLGWAWANLPTDKYYYTTYVRAMYRIRYKKLVELVEKEKIKERKKFKNQAKLLFKIIGSFFSLYE